MQSSDIGDRVGAIWRIESPKIIAHLARLIGDIGQAEELAQDALVAALESWPTEGLPDRPGAWLMTVAKRRGVDHLRRRERFEQKRELLVSDALIEQRLNDESDVDEQMIDDDLLRLVFIACHPVLATDARVALTLRLLGGLTTEEIARAYLAKDATIGQRIARAKRSLAEAHVEFELPDAAHLHERLESVLEVIYLIFNEGYTATSGPNWTRPSLCEDALRLGRILAGLMPDEAEVHGLVALMELQASRLRARIDRDGKPVLLSDQNRARWDQVLIARGLAALERASERPGVFGPYTLQAAIAACHARARTPEETDWPRIVALYDVLMAIAPSPVIALNRAVAIAMAFGPAAGLEVVEELEASGTLANYHLLPSVRADLLERLGRRDQAAVAFSLAASLCANEAERALLLERAVRASAASFG